MKGKLKFDATIHTITLKAPKEPGGKKMGFKTKLCIIVVVDVPMTNLARLCPNVKEARKGIAAAEKSYAKVELPCVMDAFRVSYKAGKGSQVVEGVHVEKLVIDLKNKDAPKVLLHYTEPATLELLRFVWASLGMVLAVEIEQLAGELFDDD